MLLIKRDIEDFDIKRTISVDAELIWLTKIPDGFESSNTRLIEKVEGFIGKFTQAEISLKYKTEGTYKGRTRVYLDVWIKKIN